MDRLLVTDSCVFINLFASGAAEEIFRESSWKFCVCQNVREEVIRLRNRQTGEVRELPLAEHIDSGLLETMDPETDRDFELLIEVTAILGKGSDGEAMCFALAASRNLPVATDDKRAVRKALAVLDDLEIVDTLAILQDWAGRIRPSRERLGEMLGNIRLWAAFEPATDHPGRAWWDENSDLI
jgi:predicted nucleic acid-binding protein